MQKKILQRDEQQQTLPLDIEALLQQLLRMRGVDAITAADQNTYSLQHLHSPQKLKGIEQAVTVLLDVLQKQGHILIVGDFDADGATSTALALNCLHSFGHSHVTYLVPNRFEYGYGLTPEIVALAAQSKPDLIITVDNGISSIDGVDEAKRLGMQVIVTDHHLPGKLQPNADAIVNPNQHGCDFPSKHLAGVGVIFYLMTALRARLREQDWFAQRAIAETNMAQFLDLVALGTVADVVPLDHNNRILVAQGIKRIRAGQCSAGILALLKIANRNHERLVADDFGFAVGPRLNAAGRLDDMSIGIRCLLSRNPQEALSLAQELDNLNQERKAIEASMQADAVRDLNALDQLVTGDNLSGISLFREDWHQGVVGIVASRVKDRMHRPTIAFARTDNGELKGSGRSISGIHLRDVLDLVATQHPALLSKFGGHAMAAGLSLPEAKLEQFRDAFNSVVEQQLTSEMKQPIILSDGQLSNTHFTLSLAEAIREAGPWGQYFPEPLFDGVFRVVNVKRVGANHLKMLLCPKDHHETLLDAICFNVSDEQWPADNVEELHLVYKLDINEYRGRQSLQLMVQYFVEI